MEKLPHWNLQSIYPAIESPEFEQDLANLGPLVDKLRSQLGNLDAQHADFPTWLLALLETYQTMLDTIETLNAYASALVTVNTNDEVAMRGLNRVEEADLAIKAIHVQVINTLAHHRQSVRDSIKHDGRIAPFHFVLEELLEEQEHTMGEAEEALAADLNRSGADAWGRLQEAVSSNADTLWNAQTGERKTVIQLRSLAFEADRSIRKKAFDTELAVWKQHEVAFAYAINGVKGTTITLDKRRGYRDPLQRATMQARIDDAVLSALIGTIEKNLEVFRRYLRAKAHCLGLKNLAFFDLFAPVGELDKRYSYDEARAFIVENFSNFHPPLGSFAEMAFEKGWIDCEPRAGKVGGAYCTSFPLRKETRILANFDHSFDGVSTIAHELGHAYHDQITSGLPALLRHYPMTLAETASIFSQFIIFKGALKEASEQQQLALIESFLQDATQTCVDILSRFYFERELFRVRVEGDIMAGQLSAMMVDAQKASYGNTLDEQALHPYMWAVKGHYYSSDLSFYNFPYAFGQLFGLGVYSLAQADPANFGARYDALLLQTGQDTASAVTASVGCDITTEDFWQQSVDVISSYVDEFCRLAGYTGV